MRTHKYIPPDDNNTLTQKHTRTHARRQEMPTVCRAAGLASTHNHTPLQYRYLHQQQINYTWHSHDGELQQVILRGSSVLF